MQFTVAEQKLLDPTSVTCCPNCKKEFVIPEPDCVEIGDWYISRSLIKYKGVLVHISPHQRRILYRLVREKNFISTERLTYLISENEDYTTSNSVMVLIYRIRKKLKALGIPDPIISKHKLGYRWNKDVLV